jgi:hypothetical protein
MLYFWNRYEVPALQTGLISATRPRQTSVVHVPPRTQSSVVDVNVSGREDPVTMLAPTSVGAPEHELAELDRSAPLQPSLGSEPQLSRADDGASLRRVDWSFNLVDDGWSVDDDGTRDEQHGESKSTEHGKRRCTSELAAVILWDLLKEWPLECIGAVPVYGNGQEVTQSIQRTSSEPSHLDANAHVELSRLIQRMQMQQMVSAHYSMQLSVPAPTPSEQDPIMSLSETNTAAPTTMRISAPLLGSFPLHLWDFYSTVHGSGPSSSHSLRRTESSPADIPLYHVGNVNTSIHEGQQAPASLSAASSRPVAAPEHIPLQDSDVVPPDIGQQQGSGLRSSALNSGDFSVFGAYDEEEENADENLPNARVTQAAAALADTDSKSPLFSQYGRTSSGNRSATFGTTGFLWAMTRRR